MRGLFITFEGVEGCGKSTQIARLRDHLESRGLPVVVTREPGGAAISEAIRAILLDPAHTEMAPMTELLLYAAARAQHVAERIRPALDNGEIVLCDRFADSTTAYQGAARHLDGSFLRTLHEAATGGLWPDLTILIDVPVEIGLERAARARRSDRIEQESLAFHERVRQGFLDLAAREPERVRIVDGTAAPDEVGRAIGALVDGLTGAP